MIAALLRSLVSSDPSPTGGTAGSLMEMFRLPTKFLGGLAGGQE